MKARWNLSYLGTSYLMRVEHIMTELVFHDMDVPYSICRLYSSRWCIPQFTKSKLIFYCLMRKNWFWKTYLNKIVMLCLQLHVIISKQHTYNKHQKKDFLLEVAWTEKILNVMSFTAFTERIWNCPEVVYNIHIHHVWFF